MAPNQTSRPDERRGLIDKLLSPFTKLEPGEGTNAILLTLSVFLLLTSYYVLKVVREPLILAAGGATLKSYTSAAQAVLLLFLLPGYSKLAGRVNRTRLIATVTLIFISNLVIFYILAVSNTPGLGIAFFIWVGIFNMMIVAQFWSYANDVYTPDQGKRLFAIIGFGQTMGAVFGGFLSKQLIKTLHVYQLLLVAAVLLFAYLLVILAVQRRTREVARDRTADATIPDKRGGFSLIAHSHYLLLIALLLWALNFANTNGEFILGRVVTGEAVKAAAASGLAHAASQDFVKQFIGSFYADYFTWVNIVTAIIQLFLVSRIMRWFGVQVALYVLPVVALGAYGMIAFVPLLALIRAAKISENSLDYSLNNTARQALFLPTTREEKYKAKAAIDTLFVRAGDLSSACLVFIGTRLAFGTREFAISNMVVIAIWLVIVTALSRNYKRVVAAPRSETVAA
ncbi:MAG TPA: Npt1/Npt2 family nucleotide transporter [Candidatus Krumholzibacteria bacterium]|nr:Npt1/Npt2 family nucleotide transporter [Candidatus Krumholzibacteria bacterium]